MIIADKISKVTEYQLNAMKAYAIAYLRSVKFGEEWLGKLSDDFRDENDLAIDTFSLARYISWHMRNNGIHIDRKDFADVCAFQAVMYALNEVLANDVKKAREFLGVPALEK